MHVQPYIFFDGRAEEAMQHYTRAIGAEVVVLMRFAESPDPAHNPPGAARKVMHAELRIGDTVVMCSDGMNKEQPEFKGVSLSLAADDAAHAERLFAALAEGGQVQMPLGETFFAERFGMVADRFGVSWMVTALKPMPAAAKPPAARRGAAPAKKAAAKAASPRKAAKRG